MATGQAELPGTTAESDDDAGKRTTYPVLTAIGRICRVMDEMSETHQEQILLNLDFMYRRRLEPGLLASCCGHGCSIPEV